MIKRQILPILIAINMTLAAALAWLWLTPKGQLRNVHWRVPEAKAADFASGLPSKPQVAPYENARLIALLDRPLFALTRRPPPPPPPPPVPPPVDTLASARLLAVYSGEGGAGAVVDVGGKSRKVRLNENVEGWTLKSIEGRSATFSSGGQSRALHIARSTLTKISDAQPFAADATSAPSAAAGEGTRRPAGPPRGVFGGGHRQ